MSVPTTPHLAETVGSSGSSALRFTVLAADAVALMLGWAAVLGALSMTTGRVSRVDAWTGLVAVVVVGLLALRATGSHERRVVRVRSRELAVTSKAALAPAFLLLALLPQTTILDALLLVAGGGLAWMSLLGISRAVVGEWIRGNRARGHLSAPVLVVGTGRARELTDFLDEHPHLGFAVADTVELIPDDGEDAVRMIVDLADTTGATGIAVTDPGDPVIAPLLPALGRAGLHVHVATGVQGLELRTAVTSSMAGELFLDFAPHRVPAWEQAAIRGVDIAVALFGLLISLPVSLVVAAAIKITDGGSVLYVQERVGRGDVPFPMLKFRSMFENAPTPVRDLESNGRQGPLTKLTNDPRITPIGRLIRATSIDELPQLLNVLRGEMSIVGPRPALQSEVDEFDAELRRRTEVRPGLTGLWQVEGRDLPSFELYRRLDLLYVDNVSLSLHVAVLLRTVTALAGHTLRSLVNGSEATLAPEELGSATLVTLPESTGTRTAHVQD